MSGGGERVCLGPWEVRGCTFGMKPLVKGVRDG